MGDFDGHPFRGNQYSQSGGVTVSRGDYLEGKSEPASTSSDPSAAAQGIVEQLKQENPRMKANGWPFMKKIADADARWSVGPGREIREKAMTPEGYVHKGVRVVGQRVRGNGEWDSYAAPRLGISGGTLLSYIRIIDKQQSGLNIRND